MISPGRQSRMRASFFNTPRSGVRAGKRSGRTPANKALAKVRFTSSSVISRLNGVSQRSGSATRVERPWGATEPPKSDERLLALAIVEGGQLRAGDLVGERAAERGEAVGGGGEFGRIVQPQADGARDLENRRQLRGGRQRLDFFQHLPRGVGAAGVGHAVGGLLRGAGRGAEAVFGFEDPAHGQHAPLVLGGGLGISAVLLAEHVVADLALRPRQ